MHERLTNILIIDDDQQTLSLLKLSLERNGFSVNTAADWDDVVYQVERHEMLNRPIDVIILDIMMPNRSGFDIFRALQLILHPMPPVVMLSAVTGMEQQIQSRDLGAAKYLTKPTTPSKLIKVLNDITAHNEE